MNMNKRNNFFYRQILLILDGKIITFVQLCSDRDIVKIRDLKYKFQSTNPTS